MSTSTPAPGASPGPNPDDLNPGHHADHERTVARPGPRPVAPPTGPGPRSADLDEETPGAVRDTDPVAPHTNPGPDPDDLDPDDHAPQGGHHHAR